MSLASSRARVLILIKGLGIGGAETLIAEAARHWDRTSFQYRVAYLLPWKDQLVPRIQEADVDVSCLGWTGPSSLGALRRLRELAMEFDPDIVHTHLPSAGVLARLSLPSAIHVYTEHNVVDFYRQPTRTLNRVTYGRNSAVIAVSDAVAMSIDRYPGPEPQVIPNGVSVETEPRQVAAIRSELGIASDTPLIVHVGNIRPHKGHATLIEATRSFIKRIPDAFVVSIGGEKQEGDLERLRRAASSAGVDGHLRFLGRRDDARPFIAAADLVINPSDVEGLPVTLLEALALGRRVVATDVGGVSSIVEDEQTGLLVPPGDPTTLASAVVRSLKSPESAEWGKEGARRVRRTHGLDRMVASYESVYRKILDG